MNRAELLAFHDEFCSKAKAIMVSKNADYAGANGNTPFANFSRVEVLFPFIKTEHGFLTRIMDKLSRIGSFVESGTLAVKDEAVEDTLLDLANYSVLLAAYIRSTRAPAIVPITDLVDRNEALDHVPNSWQRG